MQRTEKEKLDAEIGTHMMQPSNYGKLDDANGIGFGVDNTTSSYVVIHIKRDATHLLDITHGTNAATQDASTLGSLLTEMIKGEELSEVEIIVSGLEKELQELYANVPAPKIDKTKPEGEQVEHISTEHQDSANMVLTAFRAAMRHYERQQEGIKEEHYQLNIPKNCPYSMTECHFVEQTAE